MLYDAKLFLLTILGLILGAALLTGGVFYGLDKWEEYRCESFGDATGLPSKWAAFDACYVTVSGGVMTKAQYTATLIAREGLSK